MLTYEGIAARALKDSSFKEGLLAAAEVCKAQSTEGIVPCPSNIAAVYIERLAKGEMP